MAAFDGNPEEGPDRWWSGVVERTLPTETTPTGQPFIRMWFDPGGVKSPTDRPEPTPE